jgi:2-desacetyl-2-hydroxyethyl bacteriochlorophyllide A dehydrogenase
MRRRQASPGEQDDGQDTRMKALRKTAPAFGLELQDIAPPPAPGPGEVLVQVEAAGICGSDVHIYDWSGGYEFITPAMPVTLGHELAGRVVAQGPGVAEPAPGTPVVVIPSVTCGHCHACTEGDPDDCLDRRGIGMTRAGGFAPQVLAPARNCLALPPGFDPSIAALTEPLVIGARAVSVGAVAPGNRVLVMGPGTIGQAIALMAREAGAAEVTLVGQDDALRLGVLRQLGFPRLFDLSEGPLERVLDRGKYDVVFEVTGVPAVVQQGLGLLKRGGVLVVAGIHPRPASIDLNILVREQQQLRGTQRGKRADWLRAFDFVVRQGARLAPMVTHRLPLERALEGFELARCKMASKVVLLPDA